MASAKSEPVEASGQFATFFVADLFFGVDVLHVQEVLRFQAMTPVPKAPRAIEGLINLRGQIVTAIDMRRRLGLPPRDGNKSPMNIVIRTSEGAVSLLVDEIGDVLEMDAACASWPSKLRNFRSNSFILLASRHRTPDRHVYSQLARKVDALRTAQLVRCCKPTQSKRRTAERSRGEN
jgi:chemotaxis signal transduction protein